jgi:hypothetical protein
VLIAILLIFLSFAILISLRLKPGIIPDEPAHVTFSKHYASTWGIPEDTYETYSWGWYIEQNPFLYYWINGRIINFFTLLSTEISNWEILVILRLVNVVYAAGTVVFCFLLSKEVIKNRWWQLLPSFLLTNTLMFVFLAGGVNYDNLANLLSMAGLYFLVRVFTRKEFLKNSLLWMILVGAGALVKYTILPLALAMSITWLVYLIIHRKQLCPLNIFGRKTLALTAILIAIIVGNFAIYGINLIQYQSLTPPCREILLESQCEISPYEERNQNMANRPKLSVQESIALGYPSPLRYAFDDWVYHMLLRSFGMIGHQSYFPLELIVYYRIFFYGMLVLGLFTLLYKRKISFVNASLLWIVVFYAIVLLIKNYNSELIFNFMHISFQGRYIFPVIGPIFVLLVVVLKGTPHWVARNFLVIVAICLFVIGGPLVILRGYNSFLNGWFY